MFSPNKVAAGVIRLFSCRKKYRIFFFKDVYQWLQLSMPGLNFCSANMHKCMFSRALLCFKQSNSEREVMSIGKDAVALIFFEFVSSLLLTGEEL